jgi:Skp family chaperone for outer membrane proteins
MDMKQTFWIIAGVVGFLLIIGVAFNIGQILSLKNEVATYQDRLATVEKNGGASAAKLKVGVVRVNDLGLRLQAIPAIKELLQNQFDSYTKQAAQLEDQIKNGTITKAEAATQTEKMQTDFQNMTQESLLRPIQNAVNQIGSSGNYDVITKVEDVILFAQHGILEDITEKVWSQMQANNK